MQELIDNQLKFLKSQSLITDCTMQGDGWAWKATFVLGEWVSGFIY